MEKHILVPVNFTAQSAIGLATAHDIAQKVKASITLLNVIEGDSNVVGIRQSTELDAKSMHANEKQHLFLDLIKKNNERSKLLAHDYDESEVYIKTIVMKGDFKDCLETYLKENEVDLVVMGSKGESSVLQIFSNHHTAQTIDKANVPVLAVRELRPIRTYKRLLLLIDLDNYSSNALKMIKRLADMLGMETYLGYQKESMESVDYLIEQKLREVSNEHNLQPECMYLIKDDKKNENLKYFIISRQIDMVAIFSEEQSGVSRLLFGSDMEDLIKTVDVPILTVSE